MKKLLSTLAISGLVGSASTTVISCDEETPAAVAVDINTIITDKDLGSIDYAAGGSPSDEQINGAIVDQNPNYNKDYASIVITENNDNTGGTVKVTGDTTHYTGDVNVTYTKVVLATLSDAVKITELGPIVMAGDIPTIEEIDNAIKASNPDYNIGHTEIKALPAITAGGATIKALDDDTNYSGDVAVTYTKATATDSIDTIISTTQLGDFSGVGDAPDKTELDAAILAKNDAYLEAISSTTTMDNVTAATARIVSDGTTYSGVTWVTYNYTKTPAKSN